MGKWIHSQRHIWNLLFQTVAEAEASGRGFEICFVFETLTGYAFVENGSEYTVDHCTVLNTHLGGTTRWLGVFGKYNYFLEPSEADPGCIDIWCVPDTVLPWIPPETPPAEDIWFVPDDEYNDSNCTDPWCVE